MSDIDFLGHKKSGGDDEPPQKAGEKKPEVVWSEPERQANIVKATPFTFLRFLNKKNDQAKAAKKPEPAIDNNKIKQSRQEILKLIKNSANRETASKNKVRKKLFAGLRAKFAKQPNHREIMIDYQQIFNKEKANRSRPAESASPKLQRGEPLARTDKTEHGEPAKTSLAGWLGNLRKLLRLKPRPRPAKKSAAETGAKLQKLVAPEPAGRLFSDVLETNLIKGELVTFFDWRKKIIVFASAILASVVFVAAAHFATLYYQGQSQAKNLEQTKKFEDLSGKIKREEAGLKEISDFQTKLKIVSQIFAQHLYWTNFFKFLEDNTMKDVYYAGFDGDTSGHYVLEAQAVKFSHISEQANILKNNEKITGVKALGGEMVSGDENNKPRVKFTLEFSILKKIFTE